MKYLLIIAILGMIFAVPAFGQQQINPSLEIETIEIPSDDFNRVARDAQKINLEKSHDISWQVTIDNNLLYANPNGNAVLRIYDNVEEKFLEIGMGASPDEKFWVAANIPEDEGYVIVSSKLERGWVPTTKVLISYTERAGFTVNNGARIVVSNLDIGKFGIDAYSVHGMEGSTDPPAVNAGSMTIEVLSGDPSQNIFWIFPYAVTASVAGILAILFLTKKRSS